MRTLSVTLGLCLVLLPTTSWAQALPVGIYDCTLQAPGVEAKDVGVLKIVPEGFSGPQSEQAEDSLYVYLLNPDNSVNFPNEFAKNVEGGSVVVDALYYPDFASVRTTITMTDGATMHVACALRAE